MTDPSLVHTAVTHVKHVAHAIPHITQGYTMLNLAIASLVSLAVGGGLGYYVKSRGMTGVQTDLNSVKTDVENLKAKVFPTATPTPPVA